MDSWHSLIFILLYCCVLLAQCQFGQKVNPVEEFSDLKAFKQLLRTRTNVMVLFMKHFSESSLIYKTYKETALEVRGIGTLVMVDCGSAGKKLCKSLKAYPEPHLLHHYKDGKFNKLYDRRETAKSMVRFMNDPTGDIPWEEEPSGKSVAHLGSPGSLDKLIKKNKPVLVMFYAPWCVYCKQMKPDFAAAAVRVKANGDGILAAMDVLRPENIPIRMRYNITGFPTLYYFRDGKAVKTYDGDNKEDKIVEFMKDPMAIVAPVKETEWSDSVTDVVHLNQDNFNTTLQIPGILAAVDSTKETILSEKFNVRGFPTIKYFQNGEFAFNTPHLRETSKLLEFMQQPKEPPSEPPPEPVWADVPSDVVHLTEENFKNQLRPKRHALVMFYAPWCGHCKQAKPEFTLAAEQLKDLPRMVLAAVDCDEHRSLCKYNDIKGYPTFKYFRYYNKEAPQDYNGGRSAADFVNYMSMFETFEFQSTNSQSIVKHEGKQDNNKPLPEKQSTKPENFEKKNRGTKDRITLNESVKEEKDKDVGWSELKGGDRIIELTSDNFEDIVQQYPSMVVLFHASWCTHCIKLKPDYAKAALAVEPKFGVFAVCDISVSEDIADRFLIQGLPTIKYFEKGEEKSTFSGPRTTENLITFLKKGGQVGKDEL